MPADDDRNQADVLALRPGTVIELDSDTLGQTYQGVDQQPALAVAADPGDRAGERGNVAAGAGGVWSARLYYIWHIRTGGRPHDGGLSLLLDVETGHGYAD